MKRKITAVDKIWHENGRLCCSTFALISAACLLCLHGYLDLSVGPSGWTKHRTQLEEED